MRTTPLALGLLLLLGCETLPVGAGSGSNDDVTTLAAREIAAMHRKSGLELVSAGKVALVPDAGSGFEVVHLRVIPFFRNAVTNVDRAQLVAVGETAIAPLAVNADAATLPVMREAGAVDLYFPVAPRADTFAFVLPITVDGRTRDFRIELRGGQLAAEDPIGLGAATHWWFAPSRAWPTFRHQDGRITNQPPTHVELRAVTIDDREPVTEECNDW